MRRALGPRWPALSHWFGIYPWHADGGPPVLTYREIEFYEQALDAINAERR